jgi:hypothetical protein
MVIWQGWGILVLLEGALVFAAVRGLGFPEPVTGISAGLLAGVMVWFTGRWLNDPSRDRTVIVAQNGETMRLARRHTVFWIPM